MNTTTDEMAEPENQPQNGTEASTQSSTAAPANPTALEIEIYKALATLFNSEETSFWTRNNILVVVQGALIAATAAILGSAEKVLTPGAPPAAALLLFASLAVLAGVGFLMAIAWLFMVGRSERIADTISGQLKKIEKEWRDRPGVKLGKNFLAFIKFGKNLNACTTRPLLPKQWNNDIRLAVLWRKVGYGFAVFWFIAFFLFIVLALMLHPGPKEDDACSINKTTAETAAAAAIAASKSAASAEISVKLSTQAAASAEAAAKSAQLARRRSAAPACGCCASNNAVKLPN